MMFIEKGLVGRAVIVSLMVSSLPSFGQKSPEELAEIVTVARRVDMPRKQVAGSITIITAEDLARFRQPVLYDALRRVPGLRIARTGGPGQPVKLYLRGAEPRQTVVLIDGVSLRSPNDPNGNGYFLGNLSTANIERIEVLRGGQSSLYGPDAAGGIINVVTKRGRGEPSGNLSVEAGSMDTLRTTWSTNGSKARASYSFVADRHETEGVSAARSGTETDPYQNDYLQGRIDYQLGDDSKLSVFGFQADALSNADNFAGTDGSYPTKEKAYLLRTLWEFAPEDNEWFSAIGVSRKGFRSTDGFGSVYRGHTTEFDWRSIVQLSERFSLGFGIEHADDQGKSNFGQDVAMGMWGGYLNGAIEVSEGFFTEFAFRYDENDRYDSKSTGKVAFSKAWDDWRAYGNLGTFFVAPNAFYYTWASNPFTLKPESGASCDLGLERSWSEGRCRAAFTLFERKTEQEFNWNNLKVVNVDVEARGMEGELSFALSDSVAIDLALTMQETQDVEKQRDLFSRPEKMFSGVVDWCSSDDILAMTLGFRYVGSRTDAGSQPSPSFAVWDLGSSFRVKDDWDIHLRMENLFDKDYAEMVDPNGNPYGSAGRSAFLGVTWRY
ncbi:MAG: hypothetical protein CMI30_04465 [Opitutae bacterium]|nr:hypothetical protein [Opitutae bacterium]